jgi:NAD(P) transhydrogenase
VHQHRHDPQQVAARSRVVSIRLSPAQSLRRQLSRKKDITFEDLAQRCDHVVKAEQEIIQNQLLRNGIDFIIGSASFLDPHRLVVAQSAESHEHTADYIVVAVGSQPARPPQIPFDGEAIIDSDELISLKQLPKSLTIVGGGVIGCEYACILATLGIPVVLVERRPRLLEFVDSEIIESLQYQMRNIGVTLRLNEEVTGVNKASDGLAVLQLKSGKQIRSPLLIFSGARGRDQGPRPGAHRHRTRRTRPT